MIVACAGRRVDSAHAAPPRFPQAHVPLVRERLRAQLVEHAGSVLVSSAACGADLLALEVAGELGLRRVVVLPWDRERFRGRSVVDRGREWGQAYDRILDGLAAGGDLRVLDRSGDEEDAYAAVNEAILDAAEALAAEEDPPAPVLALVAWDRRSRGPHDLTGQFVGAARRRGLRVVEVMTL